MTQQKNRSTPPPLPVSHAAAASPQDVPAGPDSGVIEVDASELIASERPRAVPTKAPEPAPDATDRMSQPVALPKAMLPQLARVSRSVMELLQFSWPLWDAPAGKAKLGASLGFSALFGLATGFGTLMGFTTLVLQSRGAAARLLEPAYLTAAALLFCACSYGAFRFLRQNAWNMISITVLLAILFMVSVLTDPSNAVFGFICFGLIALPLALRGAHVPQRIAARFPSWANA